MRLIALVGPTGSGKTALSLKIAQRFNGEVVSADSRTIYKGMDIGTAKPTVEQQALVRHHLLDMVEPNQSFTVADFQKRAREAIKSIGQKGELPILVGGTGLYIDAVLYNYEFPLRASRPELATLSLARLQDVAAEEGISLNESDWNNRRRLVRALESAGSPGKKGVLRPNTFIVGLNITGAELESRIRSRVEAMIDNGLIDEVRRIGEKYGWGSEAMTAIGYREFARVINSDKSLSEATEEFIRGHLQLAKRQMTWFKRNLDIKWVESDDQAIALVSDFLAKSL